LCRGLCPRQPGLGMVEVILTAGAVRALNPLTRRSL
jgi:hypothetical protein